MTYCIVVLKKKKENSSWAITVGNETKKTTQYYNLRRTSVHIVTCAICHTSPFPTASTQTIWSRLLPYGIPNETASIRGAFELFNVNILHKWHLFCRRPKYFKQTGINDTDVNRCKCQTIYYWLFELIHLHECLQTCDHSGPVILTEISSDSLRD